MKEKPLAYLASWQVHVVLSLALLVSFALSLTRTGIAEASTTIVVNSTEDKVNTDGLCTLREAIIAANKDQASSPNPGECPAGSGADVIELPAGTYTLTRSDNGREDSSATGDLDIAGDLTIRPLGPVTITAAGGFSDRILHILRGNVTISGVTIAGGNSRSDGAGIYNRGNLTLRDSTLTGNTAGGRGGGLHNAGTASLANVTLSGNSSHTSGGGYFNENGTTTLANVTIANNTADSDNNGTGDGGGVSRGNGALNLRNTLMGGNTDRGGQAPDCSGTLTSQGYNLIANTSGCNFTPASGDLANLDPRLGALQNNGGPTATHALLTGSPAIDAGNPTGCTDSVGNLLTTDQRGEPRPNDGNRDGRFRCDVGAFESGGSPLALIRAFPNNNGGTTVHGLVDGATGSTISKIDFFSTCDPSTASPLHSSINVPTDENGYFIVNDVPAATAPGQFVSASVPDLNSSQGMQSLSSNCVTIGRNDSWPFAQQLDVSSPAVVEQYIDKLGQSRWYRFQVEPGSQVFVTLTNLPENYDLTVYKDIKQAFLAYLTPTQDDLVSLTAEFAGDAFSGDAFSGDAFSGDAFSGDAFSGDAFSGDAFSGDAFSGDAFSGDAFSGDAFSGDAFSGDAFSGDAFSGDAFSGDAFSAPIFAGDAFSGDAFSGDAFSAAFSSAQTRSLIGVSAFDGTANEGIFVNTWNNTGEFYVRVRGRNGDFSLAAPFRLQVQVQPGTCGSVLPLSDLSSQPPLGPEGNFKTLILYDSSRLDRIEGSAAEKAQLLTLLDNLAGAVNGKVIDVSLDERVRKANQQADNNPACPYAKNLVAQAIKDIVGGYHRQNNSVLEYVVIVGSDGVIPFFRHPDNAVLARESNYAPPVRNDTPSQASLKLDYVLSQDAYGSKLDLSLNNSSYPVPELAVGRLVETAVEISTVIEAFMNSGGVVAPQSTLVTGYDFLSDAAQAVQGELQAGINGDSNTSPALIADAWTAQDLRDRLLCAGCDRDLVFLAGHFTGNSALAADYATRLSAQEVAASGLDMSNNVIFSIGCHAGYNIVNQDGVPVVTRQPDWAQAFASRGASLIAGTGYQYGDTDFLEYSERIYLEFSKQLRVKKYDGGGNLRPVSIGEALVAAKQSYLAHTPHIRGLHEKALLEATIFGLPMLSVNLPNRVDTPAPPPSQAPPLATFGSNPGQTLGLAYGDLRVTSPLNPVTIPLDNVAGGPPVAVSYLEGNNQGVLTNAGEPALPLEVRNVTVPGTVLRGVGFRDGLYTDQDVIPLIGVAATEVQGVHTPFLTDFFYPVHPWRVNYWDALADSSSGITQLIVTPAQHRTSPVLSDPQTSTRRAFSEMTLRLYYSNQVADLSQTPNVSSIPALAGAPAIIRVSAVPSAGQVTFRMTVVGNPAAGIQEVWVTYTATQGPLYGRWQSLDLIQNAADSSVWEATLPLNGTAPQDVRYMVQAVNGVGLVSLATNLGQFFIPGADTLPTVGTQLEFQSPPSQGRFGTQATFSAKLTKTTDETGSPLPAPQPLANQLVTFRLGSQTGLAVTNGDGIATAELALLSLPGSYEVRTAFAGTAELKATFATTGFAIDKQNTAISLSPPSAKVAPNQDTGMVARLTDPATGRPLQEKSVFFVVTGSGGSYSVHQITDLFGRAPLGPVPLGTGVYDVFVYFSGTRTLKTEQGDVTVSLEDVSYHPSETVGSLTINSAPVAQDQSVTTDQDVPVQITLVASDPDGDPLTYSITNGPSSGTLSGEAPTLIYTPNPNFSGTDSFTFIVNDGIADSNVATVTINVNTVNQPPDCSAAGAEPLTIWPPDKNFWPVNVVNVTDPDGETITITIDNIYQDERVGNAADANILGPNAAEVRAERLGNGDGRVYHIFFTATDERGSSCTGEVRAAIVPHDQGGNIDAIDGGALFDSTQPSN